MLKQLLKQSANIEVISDKNEFIIQTINKHKKNLTWRRRTGPALHFYQKIFERKQKRDVGSLVEDVNHIELIYATLAAWDMNTRGAKMHNFEIFLRYFKNNRESFIAIEDVCYNKSKVLNDNLLKTLFDNFDIMESNTKEVAL